MKIFTFGFYLWGRRKRKACWKIFFFLSLTILFFDQNVPQNGKMFLLYIINII